MKFEPYCLDHYCFYPPCAILFTEAAIANCTLLVELELKVAAQYSTVAEFRDLASRPQVIQFTGSMTQISAALHNSKLL